VGGVRFATAVDADLLRGGFGVLLVVVAAQRATGGARDRRRYPEVS
jgi:hypothetical protein